MQANLSFVWCVVTLFHLFTFSVYVVVNGSYDLVQQMEPFSDLIKKFVTRI